MSGKSERKPKTSNTSGIHVWLSHEDAEVLREYLKVNACQCCAASAIERILAKAVPAN